MRARKLKMDMGTVVTGEHAKIASLYTGGQIEVVYRGDVAAADCRGTIFFPAVMRDVGALDDAAELLSWAFLNHEMGHEDVQRRLLNDQKERRRAGCYKQLFGAIPQNLRELGVSPDSVAPTTTDFLGTELEQGQIVEIGAAFAREFGCSAKAATQQIRILWNCAEDPRQERGVSDRWEGAARHLLHGLEYTLAIWKKRVAQYSSAGSGSFFVFAVALAFLLRGRDVAFFGTAVAQQLETVADLVDIFEREADWNTHRGHSDSINFALAVLARVHAEAADGQGFTEEGETSGAQAQGSGGTGEEGGAGESGSGGGGQRTVDALEPGMIVTVKATGQRAKIVRVFGNGSIKVEAPK